MKVVIQCAGSKQPNAPRLRTPSGREVHFVARPEFCSQDPSVVYCKPDALEESSGESWRSILVRYNQDASNPLGLLRAGDLYRPSIYRELVDAFGYENVFILSAGWGLIRSDFLTPDYDITFSTEGEKWSRRRKRSEAAWKEFNHLVEAKLQLTSRSTFSVANRICHCTCRS